MGDVLQPNAEIKLRHVEPGDFLVDAPLGLAPGVLEVWPETSILP